MGNLKSKSEETKASLVVDGNSMELELNKIRAIAAINNEIVQRIESNTDAIITVRKWNKIFVDESNSSNLSFELQKTQTKGSCFASMLTKYSSGSYIIETFVHELALLKIEDTFNDKLNFKFSTLSDVKFLNTKMLPIAEKYKMFGGTEQSLDVLKQFKYNFEVLQVFLGKLESSLMDTEDPSESQHEKLYQINNLYNELISEGVDINLNELNRSNSRKIYGYTFLYETREQNKKETDKKLKNPTGVAVNKNNAIIVINDNSCIDVYKSKGDFKIQLESENRTKILALTVNSASDILVVYDGGKVAKSNGTHLKGFRYFNLNLIIVGLATTKNGNILAVTEKSIVVYDGTEGKVIQTVDSYFKTDIIRAVTVNSKDEILVLTSSLYELYCHTFTSDLSTLLSSKTLEFFHNDLSKKFTMTTTENLIVITYASNYIFFYDNLGNLIYEINEFNRIGGVTFDRKGNLVITNSQRQSAQVYKILIKK